MTASLQFCLPMQPSHHDHNHLDMQGSFLKDTSATTSASAPNQHPKKYFPFKLLQLLEDCTLEGNENIASWLPHGKAFKVHKPTDFENKLIRRYFRQTKYRSFVRQLYHYRFARIDFGEDKGAYYHPDFQRHNKERCISLQRNISDEIQSSTQLGHRLTPSVMEGSEPGGVLDHQQFATSITPAMNIDDFKIALGTDANMADIHASRALYNNLSSSSVKAAEMMGDAKPSSMNHAPDKISFDANSHFSAASTFQPSMMMMMNNNNASSQQGNGSRTQGDQNWLGTWLARHYGGNENDSGHIDLEPRPIQDMNKRGEGNGDKTGNSGRC